MPLWFGNQDREDESNPIYGTAKVLIAGGLGGRARQRAVEYLLQAQNSDGGWGGGESVAAKIRHLTQTDSSFSKIDPQIPPGLVSSVEESALAVEALTTLILRNRPKLKDSHADSEHLSAPERSDRAVSGLKGDPESQRKPAAKESMDRAGESFDALNDRLSAAILRGVDFLTHSVEDRRHQVAWPIGFYFAKLWYHERLYPLIFVAAALGKFLRATDKNDTTDWPR